VQDLEQQINQDVSEYLNSIDRLDYNDRSELLKIMIKKFALLGSSDTLLFKKDLVDIVSSAKLNFSYKPMPVKMSDSDLEVHQSDLGHLCMIEATIGHLNKHGCLKKVPKFDYRKK